MAHTTVNGTTTAEAVADAGGANLIEARQDRLLRTSERIVAKLAPAPEETDAAYTQAASDTEIAVFGYFVTTDEGKTSSESVSSISTSFRTYVEFVRPIVRDGMGSYYSGGTSADVGYIGAFPR